tara:strand:+ start:211 stop:411 length:201 start_codon:yes stop_codon:yes gene_type:complete
MKTDFRAFTLNPNTPETDLLEEVLHVVIYTQTVHVMAKDPSDAIDKIRKGERENELDRKIQAEESK